MALSRGARIALMAIENNKNNEGDQNSLQTLINSDDLFAKDQNSLDDSFDLNNIPIVFVADEDVTELPTEQNVGNYVLLDENLSLTVI